MVKYEYKVIGLDLKQADADLNKLGHQGWEAIGLSETSPSVIRVILKRPLSSNEPFMAGV